MKDTVIALRIISIALLSVHVYNVFYKEQIPKWSWGLFIAAMLINIFIATRTYLKKQP